MGRAPTSGYCENCRKRKVKCDKTRPHCRRCLKSGRGCGGYDLPLRMQNHGLVRDYAGTEKMVMLHDVPAAATSSVTAVTAPRLTPRVARTNEELTFSYFFQNFVWAHFWRPIMRMVDLPPGRVAYKASLAIATGIRGLGQDDRALKLQALDLYGNAINLFRQQINQAIGHKPEMAALGTTVIMLSLFNPAVYGDVSPVDQKGLIAILKYCGPEPFKEESLLTVFRSYRAHLICRSLDQGEGTFLEQSEWKTVPWLQCPKTADDKLQDIVVNLPSITETLKSPAGLSQEHTLELLGQLNRLSSQLDTWRWEWEEMNRGAAKVGTMRGHDTGTISEPVLADLLSSRIEMQSVTQGFDIYLYNTVRVYISRQRQILLGNAQRSKGDRKLSPEDLQFMETTARRQRHSPLLLPGEARLPCQFAMEAARLMPYLAEKLATREDDVTLMVSPTWILISALRSQPELEEWAWTLRSRVNFLRGPPRELFDIFKYYRQPYLDSSM